MVKDGANTKLNRVYDEDGFLKRAAAVCVKDSDQNQVNKRLSDNIDLIFTWLF